MPEKTNRDAMLYDYARSVVDERHRLANEIAQRDFWLSQLRAEYDDINARCRDHEAHIARLTQALDTVQNSLAWRITGPLRAVGSKLGGARAPQPSGETAPAPPAEAPPAEPTPPTPLVLTPALPADGGTLPDADAIVSFIIPSYNGAEDLATLLPLLFQQRGLARLEVILVDSGSTDGSPRLAAEQGAVVVEIPHEKFTHAYARNLGAERAGGDYLLFLTQDALPTGPWWARRMLQPLLDGKAVAASCREIPRPDAQLYPKMGIWHHTAFLGLNGQDRLTTWPGEEDQLAIRQNALLNNIATVVRRDIFSQYLFEGRYAEDLGLGIRLLRDGHPLALLGTEQVIHSHNRSASYALKRGCVCELAFPDILPNYPLSRQSVPALLSTAIHGYRQLSRLTTFLRGLAGTVQTLDDLSHQMEVFRTALPLFYVAADTTPPPPIGEATFDDTLARLYTLYQATDTDDTDMAEGLSNYYIGTILPYLQAHPQPVTPPLLEEIIDSFERYYAFTLGILLGSYAYAHPIPGDALTALALPLAEGV